MPENQSEFKGWARVEVMGHQTHIGYVETQAFGGTVMFRVDQPGVPGVEQTLERTEYFAGQYVPAGSVVKREDIAPASVLIGAGSIYRIIPCDEAAAMAAIRENFRPPLMVVKLAEVQQITDGDIAAEQDPDDGREDSDDYMPGGF
jgi:hypothetical protein